MANPIPYPPPGFDEGPIEEQIDYVQALWDRIATNPERVPVPEWHHQMLAERVEEYQRNPGAGETWDVVKKRLGENLRVQDHNL